MDSGGGRGIRIVVADESDDIRMVLRRSLELARLTVVGEAKNGLEALVAVRTHLPDAIVVDLDLPAVSGSELVDAVRRHSPATKIVTCSATYSEVEAMEAGSDAFLPKPIDRSRLLEMIELLCREDTQ